MKWTAFLPEKETTKQHKINKYSFSCSSDYCCGSNTFADLADSEFPNNFDITHSVSLASTYSLNNLDVSAGLNWHSGKPTTKPVNGNEPANSSRLDDYMRVDVSAQYRFRLSKSINATAGISIWNLLNKENSTNFSGMTNLIFCFNS